MEPTGIPVQERRVWKQGRRKCLPESGGTARTGRRNCRLRDMIMEQCREKRDISKYRLSQLSGISQSSLGRIMAQENLPSLITLEKICAALGVTLSQFFQEGNSENLTEKQKEVLGIWNDLSTNEQETVMSMLRGLRK